MKAKKSKFSATRHYHISLMVFLVALGLTPISLMSRGVSANTEGTPEHNTESSVEKSTALKLKISETTNVFPVEEDYPWGDPFRESVSKEILTKTDQTEKDLVDNISTGETPATEITAVEAVATEEILAEPTYEIATDYETPVYELPVYDQINIAGNTIPIFYSNNTLIDAGNQVGLYGSHFLYGHNSANVFGGLSGMGIGSYFTVTLGGETKTYQVVNTDLQTKSHFEGDVIRKTVVSGVTVLTKMKMMKAITAYGEYNGGRYDYILMTCAGTSYGNGDASHRLILMANEV